MLAVSLVIPAGGLAQTPPTAGPREPQAQVPAQPAPLPPSVEPPLRVQGGTAVFRPDICGQPVSIGGARVAPGPEYRLGPGDVVDIQIIGRLDATRQQVTVDTEGRLNVPPLGAVEVGGLSLQEANRKVGEYARGLLRFVDVTVSVLVPRCFEVVLSGEIEHPGAIQASAVRRVHEVVLAAGGITPRGSLRHVTIVSGGATREIDLLRFELGGDLAQNPLVAPGMRIHVPPRIASVTLTGAFRRPGEYELGPSASLGELLELTGGLAQSAAASQARLTRVLPDGHKETASLDLARVEGPPWARPADVTLQAGDALFVPSLGILQDVVEVRGAFNGTDESSRTTTSGKATIVQRFELARGDRIRDIVGRAGGAAAFADLRLAFVERTGVAGPRQRIPVDLHRLLVDKDDAQNIVLDNGDVFTLPIIEDKVYILGEVKSPGPVDFRPDLTPREYIAMAGGPTVRARFAHATVTYKNGKTYSLASAPPLEPGSVVTIPEVAVRWYQDYLQIALALGTLLTAYTGMYLVFSNPNIR